MSLRQREEIQTLLRPKCVKVETEAGVCRGRG
jgi:hypothetical protein